MFFQISVYKRSNEIDGVLFGKSFLAAVLLHERLQTLLKRETFEKILCVFMKSFRLFINSKKLTENYSFTKKLLIHSLIRGCQHRICPARISLNISVEKSGTRFLTSV